MKTEPKPGRFDGLRTALTPIAAAMGLHLEARRSTVAGDPVMEDELVFRMPVLRVTAKIDDAVLLCSPPRGMIDHVMMLIESARDRLFHDIRAHLATHDRSPTDRLQQIEAAARATLPANAWNDTKAQGDLRALLDAKPGAVSWRPCLSDPDRAPKETTTP